MKCLTVADDFSHEAVDIAVDYGISGQGLSSSSGMARFLMWAAFSPMD